MNSIYSRQFTDEEIENLLPLDTVRQVMSSNNTRLIQSQEEAVQEQQAPERGIGGTLWSSTMRGVDNTQGLLYGGVGMLGDAMGSDTIRDFGYAGYLRNKEEADENKAEIGSYKNIRTDENFLGDAGTYTLETIVELAPTFAAMIAGGAVGGGLAATSLGTAGLNSVARTALTKLAEKEVGKRIAAGMTKEAAEQAFAKTAGKLIGAWGSSSLMEGGGMYTEDADVRGIENANPYSAIGFGAASGATDVVFGAEGSLLKTLAGAGGKKATKQLEAHLGKEMMKGMASEGLQEIGQELLAITNVELNNPGHVDADMLQERVIESGLKGAIGGGPISAYNHMGNKAAIADEKAKLFEQAEADRAKLRGIDAELSGTGEQAAATQTDGQDGVNKLTEQQPSVGQTAPPNQQSASPAPPSGQQQQPSAAEAVTGNKLGINGPGGVVDIANQAQQQLAQQPAPAQSLGFTPTTEIAGIPIDDKMRSDIQDRLLVMQSRLRSIGPDATPEVRAALEQEVATLTHAVNGLQRVPNGEPLARAIDIGNPEANLGYKHPQAERDMRANGISPVPNELNALAGQNNAAFREIEARQAQREAAQREQSAQASQRQPLPHTPSAPLPADNAMAAEWEQRQAQQQAGAFDAELQRRSQNRQQTQVPGRTPLEQKLNDKITRKRNGLSVDSTLTADEINAALEAAHQAGVTQDMKPKEILTLYEQEKNDNPEFNIDHWLDALNAMSGHETVNKLTDMAERVRNERDAEQRDVAVEQAVQQDQQFLALQQAARSSSDPEVWRQYSEAKAARDAQTLPVEDVTSEQARSSAETMAKLKRFYGRGKTSGGTNGQGVRGQADGASEAASAQAENTVGKTSVENNVIPSDKQGATVDTETKRSLYDDDDADTQTIDPLSGYGSATDGIAGENDTDTVSKDEGGYINEDGDWIDTRKGKSNDTRRSADNATVQAIDKTVDGIKSKAKELKTDEGDSAQSSVTSNQTPTPDNIVIDKDNSVIADIPGDAKEKLSLKEQKHWLVTEVEAAITDAENTPGRISSGKPYEFHVPGDGHFKVKPEHLLKFRDTIAKKFPTTHKSEPSKPRAKLGHNNISTRSQPTGRINEGEYYNEWSHHKASVQDALNDEGSFVREVRIASDKKNKPLVYYDEKTGFVTNGFVAIAVESKPSGITIEQNTPNVGAFLSRIEETCTVPVEPVGVLRGDDSYDGVNRGRNGYKTIVRTSVHAHLRDTKAGTIDVIVNASAVDAILTEHPGASAYTDKEGSTVIFKAKGKIVGAASAYSSKLLTEYHRSRIDELSKENNKIGFTRSITTKNDTQYSTKDGNKQSVDTVVNGIKAKVNRKAFGGRVKEVFGEEAQYEDLPSGNVIVTMSNGSTILVRQEDKMVHHADQSVEVNGSWKNREQVLRDYGVALDSGGILSLSKTSDASTLTHEQFHAAMSLALTEGERKLMLKHYRGKDKANKDLSEMELEELMAYDYQKWSPTKPSTMFGKIYSMAKGLKRALFGDSTPRTPDDVFKKVRNNKSSLNLDSRRDVKGGTRQGKMDSLRERIGKQKAAKDGGVVADDDTEADAVATEGTDGTMYQTTDSGVTLEEQYLEHADLLARIGAQKSDQSMFKRLNGFTWALAKASEDSGERVKDLMFGRLRASVFDVFDRIRVLGEKADVELGYDKGITAYMSTRIATSIDSIMASFLTHGGISWNEGVSKLTTQDQGFLNIAHDLGEDLRPWLYSRIARRAERLMELGLERNLSVEDIETLKQITDERKALNADKWDAADEQYEALQKQVLDFAVQSGTMSAADIETWNNADYIPFYRIMEDAFGEESTLVGLPGGSKIKSGIKKLEGKDMALDDPVTNIVKNWTIIVSQAMRNNARTKVIDVAQDLGGVVERVPSAFKGREDVVNIMRNGRHEYYRVMDLELYKALTIAPSKAPDNIGMLIGQKAKKLLTYGATFSPDFRLANFLRDTIQTMALYKDYSFMDAVDGFKKAWNEDIDYIQLKAAGGAFSSGFLHGADPQSVVKYVEEVVVDDNGKSVIKRIGIKKLLDTWAKIGDAAENANRVALYSKLKESKGELQAAYEAKDLLDFSMRGSSKTLQLATTLVPFLNARIAGLYKVRRSVSGKHLSETFTSKNERKDELIRMAKLLTTTSVALTAAAMATNKDKWDKLKDHEKWGYYHVFVGDSHFRIPKPFEIGAIFSSLPEAIFDSMDKGDARILGNFLSHTMRETFAMEWKPQIVKPIAELWANKDSFTGEDIVPLGMEYLSPELQFKEQTPELYKSFGKAFGVSPAKVEHLVTGYTAALGMMFATTMDITMETFGLAPSKPINPNNIWLYGKIVRDDDLVSAKQISQFYDFAKRVDETAYTIKALQREGDKDALKDYVEDHIDYIRNKRVASTVRNEFQQIRLKRMSIARSSELSTDEKDRQLRLLIKRRNDIATKVVDALREQGLD